VLVSQYLPTALRGSRSDRSISTPGSMVVDHVCSVLEGYSSACMPPRDSAR